MKRNRFKPSSEIIEAVADKWAKADIHDRVLPKKGTFNRGLILDEDHTKDDVTHNWMMHATKGWRRRRVYGASS